MRKGTKRSNSISQTIRDFASQNPSMSQAQIVRELVSQGHKVYPGLVSQALRRGKLSGGKKKKSSKSTRPSKPTRRAEPQTTELGLSLEHLKATANFVKLCGSTSQAIASIRAYEKIIALLQ
jgi:arginine repressor